MGADGGGVSVEGMLIDLSPVMWHLCVVKAVGPILLAAPLILYAKVTRWP